MKSKLICRALFGLTFALALLAVSCNPSTDSAEQKDDKVEAERKKLQGTWVDAYALDKEKTKLTGGYYTFIFKGETVRQLHAQVEDGELAAVSGHSGTYKLDITTDPKIIDIVLKSPKDDDWKYLGIYEFEGDTLKLCLNKNNRPTAFERKDANVLHVLKRPPKE